jgi:hypothetical protein
LPCWRVGQIPRFTVVPTRSVPRCTTVDPSISLVLDHFPSRAFAINQAWLAVVMLATDLTAWTQHLLLDGELAKAEPKALRCRLLHVAARLTRGQRRLWVRIQQSWPWARDLAAAFDRLAALPVPTG